MNRVYITVEILEIKYKFLPKDKKKAIRKIKRILNNNSEIEILAYDKMADKCYRKLKKNKIVVIEGVLNTEMKIILLSFENMSY